jgi:hypothetical protein
LSPVPTPLPDDGDADDDGMDDGWETDRGLDPTDPTDHSTVMASGYTAIEEYINGLAQDLVPGVFEDGFETGDANRWSARVP